VKEERKGRERGEIRIGREREERKGKEEGKTE
jgi:hypothetical protein